MSRERSRRVRVLVLALVVLAGLAAMAAPGAQATGSACDDTTAACRRAPECWIDSDCDLICGVGLGHCVHSNCPVRICKCR